MTAAVMSLPDRSPLPFDPAMPSQDRCRMLIAAFPQPLQDILESGHVERRPRFSNDAFDGLSETWLPPPDLTGRESAMAQRALDELERSILTPADPSHLLGRILALLSHYPAKNHTPDVEQLIAMDWVEDLGEFPAWAIDHAARIWRRTKKWRPSIAEMRALCEESCTRERALADRLRAIARAGDAAASAGTVAGVVESLAARISGGGASSYSGNRRRDGC